MLGEKVSATDAERMGMIYKVFPDESFREEAMKIAETLAQMPTKGLAYTKQLLNLSQDTSFHEQLNDENIFQQRAATTQDYKEGVQAFLEKRPGKFKGEWDSRFEVRGWPCKMHNICEGGPIRICDPPCINEKSEIF